VDSSGNIFIADTQNSVIREVLASTGNIQTVVGVTTIRARAVRASTVATAARLSADLCLPSSVFVDGSSNIFIADFGNSAVREVVASTGDIQTVAGTGVAGYNADNIPAKTASSICPQACLSMRPVTSSSPILLTTLSVS